MADNNDTPTSKIAKQVIREITGEHNALKKEKSSQRWWAPVIVAAFAASAGWLVGYGSLSAKSDASQKAIDKLENEKVDKDIFEVTLNGLSQQMIDNRKAMEEIRSQLTTIISVINKRKDK